MEMFHFRAMNTDISFAAQGDPTQLAPGFEKARQFILESERKFTRFSEDSELSQLNRAAGSWFTASANMLEVILLAEHYVELTQGLFDPSILPDLQRIGYDRSMDLIRAEGVFSLPNSAPRQRVPFNGIMIRPEESLIYLPPGLSLDLGGIAKGWIAEKAAAILAKYSPSCGVSPVCGVNAGGDMYLVGLPENNDGWPVDLEDPRNPGEIMGVLNVPPGGVATSAITKRAWKQGEKQRHHLIDPRSGEPAETDWLSVTVIAAHTHQCEVFAKALLIAGPREAQKIAQNADISFLAIDRDGNIVGTQASLEFLYDR
jgi:thiamine biosynthesis lipoprotein